MRFYFHITSALGLVEDEEGMDLPTFLSALHEADELAQGLREDPETRDLAGGVVQIVGASGQFFLAIPISPERKKANFLH